MSRIEPEYRCGDGYLAKVIRTRRRKSVDIRVEDGAVSIIVPLSTSIDRIDQLLDAKRQWIKEKVTLQSEMTPPASKHFVSGEAFSYLGRNYRLKIETSPIGPVKLHQGRLAVPLPQDYQQPHIIRSALAYWYKQKARQRLHDKVARLAPLVGVATPPINVRDFEARWGSCTAKGRVEFNWKIIMAPHSIVDYVVVHELCHLLRHDHSPEFWQEVARVLPDYSAARDWLRENAPRLSL